MTRSTRSRFTGALAVLAAAALALTGCSPAAGNGSASAGGSGQKVTVTVRLWDNQVQKAYDASFKEFTANNPDITVKTVLVPWANYWDKLRADVSAGNADDISLMNASNFKAYADSGNLLEIGSGFDAEKKDWVDSSVQQYTYQGKLWGVPQLTDGGIAVYYNKKLVQQAGVDVSALTWNPDRSKDTLIAATQKLTKDANGRTAGQPGFDANRVTQWGYNASQDLQAIYYNYIGSNGGKFEDGNRFVFASDPSTQAFAYIVDLINKYRVAPSAANTNDNGDFTRDQFLQGKIALFQSGLYNLKNVSDGATFDWGIAPLPAGPKGAVSVVNSVVAVGNAKTANPDATTKVLQWLGSAEGARFIGAEGAALPAVKPAQDAFNTYWKGKGVDPTPFAKAAEGEVIQAPSNAKFQAAQAAFSPIFNEIFLGRRDVASGLDAAEAAANKAAGQG